MFLLSNVRILELRYALPSCSTPLHGRRPHARSHLRGTARQRPPTPWLGAHRPASTSSLEDNAFGAIGSLNAKRIRGMDLVTTGFYRPSRRCFKRPRPRAWHHRPRRRARRAWCGEKHLDRLDELGADCIGHGVQAIHDAEVVARLAKTACLWNCAYGATLTGCARFEISPSSG